MAVVTSEQTKLPLTRVLPIVGLDIEATGSKSFFSLSSGLTLIIKRQMLSSTIKQNSTSVPA